jgi:16S rRNA (cytidine1402-2'-O)-methyltransferase
MPDEPARNPLAPGLYLVATPIGNLGDITLRALDVLRRVDRIACEDTRQTQKLLNHFEITTPTVSCHQHNEHTARRRADRSAQGRRPHRRGLRRRNAGHQRPRKLARRRGHRRRRPVIPIPGANAALSALVASGLPTDEFHFIGFLPEKAGARRTRLEALAAEVAKKPRPAHAGLLRGAAPHSGDAGRSGIRLGSRPARRVARELTKIHEEFLRGTVAEARRELAGRDRIRGEITLLVEARPRTNQHRRGKAFGKRP